MIGKGGARNFIVNPEKKLDMISRFTYSSQGNNIQTDSLENYNDENKYCRTFRVSKGQSPLITHAIMVGFSVFLVYAVISTLTSIKTDYQEIVGGSEISGVCFIIKSGIDKVYAPDSYNTSATNLGSIEISLPDRITDLKYEANFFNRSMLIKSSLPAFNQTCKIGYNVAYNGSTSGGLTRISYIKNTTSETIEMVKL